MAVLKGLHGSTGFWGLTHRGIRGIVCSSGGGETQLTKRGPEDRSLPSSVTDQNDRVRSPIETARVRGMPKNPDAARAGFVRPDPHRGWMNYEYPSHRGENWIMTYFLFSAVFILWWLHFAVCNTNQCSWIYLVIQARHQQLMCPHLKSSVLRLPMSNAIERHMSGDSLLLTRTKCVRHRNG